MGRSRGGKKNKNKKEDAEHQDDLQDNSSKGMGSCEDLSNKDQILTNKETSRKESESIHEKYESLLKQYEELMREHQHTKRENEDLRKDLEKYKEAFKKEQEDSEMKRSRKNVNIGHSHHCTSEKGQEYNKMEVDYNEPVEETLENANGAAAQTPECWADDGNTWNLPHKTSAPVEATESAWNVDSSKEFHPAQDKVQRTSQDQDKSQNRRGNQNHLSGNRSKNERPNHKQDSRPEKLWQKNVGSSGQYRHDGRRGKNIIEIDGDLFTAPPDNSLAHCVAEDLRMGSGIAVQFRQQYKRVEELLGQRKKVGQVAVLDDNDRYIYYLITKKLSTGKPRLDDLRDSLLEMKSHIQKHEVNAVSMPRIGCGLDRLHWREVRGMLQEIFEDVDVMITVYNFTENPAAENTSTSKKSSVWVVQRPIKLVNISRDTLLILFGTVCGHVDKTMEELDKKFRFIQEYRDENKKVGDVLEINRREILCILIVKEREQDLLSYPAMGMCFAQVRKIAVREQFEYLGLEAFIEREDDLTVEKIISLIKGVLFNLPCEFWICLPPHLSSIREMHRSHTADSSYNSREYAK